MPPIFKYALSCALGVAIAAPANATVLTFDGLPGPDNAAFSTLIETGYTISYFNGSVFQNLLLGNGAPSLTLADDSTPYGSIFIKRTDGGTFNALNIDISGASYSAFGYLGGQFVSGYFATATNTFATYTLPSGMIDLLTIAATPLQAGNPALIDNVELLVDVSPVPEPSNWMLLMAGFGMLGFTLRNKKQSLSIKYR